MTSILRDNRRLRSQGKIVTGAALLALTISLAGPVSSASASTAGECLEVSYGRTVGVYRFGYVKNTCRTSVRGKAVLGGFTVVRPTLIGCQTFSPGEQRRALLLNIYKLDVRSC